MLNLNKISIILVKPQMGENIGASARVMKNFGITDLRIVNPRDGWPNEKARSMSAGAKDIIENTKVFDNTGDAVQDLNFLYATTARNRDLIKPLHEAEEIVNEISKLPQTQKIGIMFGQENNGLDNDDISLANSILTLPINKEYSSLNLSQAVGIICYEIFKNTNTDKTINTLETQETDFSERKDIISLVGFLEQKMDKEEFYSVPEKKEKMMINIKNIFTRHHFTKKDIQTLRGILKIEG